MNWGWEKSVQNSSEKSFGKPKRHHRERVPWLFEIDWNWFPLSGIYYYWWRVLSVSVWSRNQVQKHGKAHFQYSKAKNARMAS